MSTSRDQEGNEQRDPLKEQVAGTHYKGCAIQPIEYIFANGLGYCEGNVVKYVTRYKDKAGVEDLKKAKHYLELLIQQKEQNEKTNPVNDACK